MRVSTHATLRVATNRHERYWLSCTVSTHATLRVATMPEIFHHGTSTVSTHATLRVATLARSFERGAFNRFNSRDPAGRDATGLVFQLITRRFQLTRPCGSRHTGCLRQVWVECVSTHATLRVATQHTGAYRVAPKFQLTRPCGSRRSTA